MRFVLVSLSVLLPSCTSFEWKQIPAGVPSTWRSRELHNGDAAFVLATGEGAAQSTYGDIEALARAVHDFTGLRLKKGLVIAVESDDPPLQLYVENPFPQIEQWHGKSVGDVQLGRAPDDILRAFGPEGIDPLLAVNMMAHGIPTDDEILGLPLALRERVSWILVLPTKECVDTVLSEILYSAMRKELAMWDRVLSSPFLVGMQGDAIQHARSQLAEVAYHVPLLTLGLTMKDTTSLKKFCLYRVGLSNKDLEREFRARDLEELEKKIGR